MSDDIDVIEELKAAIADVQASGEKWDGLAPWSYPGGLAAAFIAKHGPALIKAVELAEAVDAFDHEGEGDRLLETDPLSTPELQAAYKALDAYRAAKLENKDA